MRASSYALIFFNHLITICLLLYIQEVQRMNGGNHMQLKNLRLSIANVNTVPNKKDFDIIDITPNRVRQEDGTYGKDVESYSLCCCVYHGDILKVKVEKEHLTKITEIKDALRENATVSAVFSNLKLRAYAMQGSDGKVISGISAKADDFTYEITPEADSEIIF